MAQNQKKEKMKVNKNKKLNEELYEGLPDLRKLHAYVDALVESNKINKYSDEYIKALDRIADLRLEAGNFSIQIMHKANQSIADEIEENPGADIVSIINKIEKNRAEISRITEIVPEPYSEEIEKLYDDITEKDKKLLFYEDAKNLVAFHQQAVDSLDKDLADSIQYFESLERSLAVIGKKLAFLDGLSRRVCQVGENIAQDISKLGKLLIEKTKNMVKDLNVRTLVKQYGYCYDKSKSSLVKNRLVIVYDDDIEDLLGWLEQKIDLFDAAIDRLQAAGKMSKDYIKDIAAAKTNLVKLKKLAEAERENNEQRAE